MMQTEAPTYPQNAFSLGQRTLRGLCSGLAGGALGGLAAGYLATLIFFPNLIALPWQWSAAFALVVALVSGRLLGVALARRLRITGLGYMLAVSAGFWLAVALLAFLFPRLQSAGVQTLAALARVAIFAMGYGALAGILGGTLLGALLTEALARRIQGWGWLLGLAFALAIVALLVGSNLTGMGWLLLIACAGAALGGLIAEREYTRLLFAPRAHP